MSKSVQFLVQPLPASPEQLQNRLRHLSLAYLTEEHPAFAALDGLQIKDCAISPSHVAFLLEDGRICRLAHSLSNGNSLASMNASVDVPSTNEHGPGPAKVRRSVSSPSPLRRRDLSQASVALNILRPHNPSRLGLASTLMRLNSEPASGASGNAIGSGGEAARGAGAGGGNTLSVRSYANARDAVRLVTSRGHAASNWPRVPSHQIEVPDELIAQAQQVLQGKSRQTIIRELQRTNLDINLALNNLLGRDDDEGEEDEGGEGDDIVAFMDQHGHAIAIAHEELATAALNVDLEQFLPANESVPDIFGFPGYPGPSSRRRRRAEGANGNSNSANSGNSNTASSAVADLRRSLASDTVLSLRPRMRSVFDEDGTDGGNLRRRKTPSKTGSSSGASKPAGKASSSSKDEILSNMPLKFGSKIEWWIDENDGGAHFVSIAAMYSELLAVDSVGRLCQWRWDSPVPYRQPPGTLDGRQMRHPRAEEFGLDRECIVLIDACYIRCSVSTDSGKVCSFLDDTLSGVRSQLEHGAVSFPELSGGRLEKLHVCELLTVARTKDGNVYWWGLMPASEQHHLLEKQHTAARKSNRGEAKQPSGIKLGSEVRLRSSPLFSVGTKALNLSGTHPRIGILQESAWKMTEECRFRVASSLGESDTGQEQRDEEAAGISSSSIVPPRKRRHSECETEERTEVWRLKDLIFVDCSQGHGTVGKVVQLDGPFAAVCFPKTSQAEGCSQTNEEAAAIVGEVMDVDSNIDGSGNILKRLFGQLRLLRLDDLQLVSDPAKSSNISSLVQAEPKKLRLPTDTEALTCATSPAGVTVLLKPTNGEPLNMVTFSLETCRPAGTLNIAGNLSSSLLQADGKNHGLNLHSAGVQASIVALQDRRRALFPVAQDCSGSTLRVPVWPDLPPVQCLSSTISHMDTKSSLSIIMIVFKEHKLMPHILRSDCIAVKECLAKACETEGDGSAMEELMSERCDGDRNILHMCLQTCQPLSSAQEKLITESMSMQRSRLAAASRSAVMAPLSASRHSLSPFVLSPTMQPWQGVGALSGGQRREDSSANPTNPSALSTMGGRTSAVMSAFPILDHPVDELSVSSQMPSSQLDACSGVLSGNINEHVDVDGQAGPSSSVSWLERLSGPPVDGLGDSCSVPPPNASAELPFVDSPPYLGGSFSPSSGVLPMESLPPPVEGSSVLVDRMASASEFVQLVDADNLSARSFSTTAATVGMSPSPAISEASVDSFATGSFGADCIGGSVPPLTSASQESADFLTGPELVSTELPRSVVRTNVSTFGIQPGDKAMGFLSSSCSVLRNQAHSCLELLCNEKCVRPYLIKLLQERNVHGLTPFMAAVECRDYQAASVLLEVALELAQSKTELNVSPMMPKNIPTLSPAKSTYAELPDVRANEELAPAEEIEEAAKKKDNSDEADGDKDSPWHKVQARALKLINRDYSTVQQDVLLSMVFPKNCDPDLSPLFLLCANGCCSYGWSGSSHIPQDIYECYTCGLTDADSLCCCTECAMICHRGHDCRRKSTPPSAYCDCSLECGTRQCRAMVAGSQEKRVLLIRQLLDCTDLANRYNSQGEPLLLFALRVTTRHLTEQKQRNVDTNQAQLKRRRMLHTMKGELAHAERYHVLVEGPDDGELEVWGVMEAILECLAADWQVVRTAVLCGTEKPHLLPSTLPENDISWLLGEADQLELSHSESGCQLLDNLSFLFTRYSNFDSLYRTFHTFLATVAKHAVKVSPNDESRWVARRVARSILRVYIVHSIDQFTLPGGRQSRPRIMDPETKCRLAVKALGRIGVEECLEAALSLITPVMLGYVTMPQAHPVPSSMGTSSAYRSDQPDSEAMRAIFSAAPLVDRQAKQNGRFDGHAASQPASVVPSRRGSIDSDDSNSDDDDVNDTEELGSNEERQPEVGRGPMAMLLDEAAREISSEEDRRPDTPIPSTEDQATLASLLDDGSSSGEELVEDGAVDLDDYVESGEDDDEEAQDPDDEEQLRAGDIFRAVGLASSGSGGAAATVRSASLRWALPPTQSTPGDGERIRRSAVASLASSSSSPSVTTALRNLTQFSSAAALCKGFASVVQVLMNVLYGLTQRGKIAQPKDVPPSALAFLQTSAETAESVSGLRREARQRLQPVWDWLVAKLDLTEARLRQGAVVVSRTNPSKLQHPLRPGVPPTGSNLSTSSLLNKSATANVSLENPQHRLLTFVLHTLRAGAREAGDGVPAIEADSLPPLLHVLDAMLMLVTQQATLGHEQFGEQDHREIPGGCLAVPTVPAEPGQTSTFFRRTPSTICLGICQPSSLAHVSDGLPLAEKPQLLEPQRRRESMLVSPNSFLSEWSQPCVADSCSHILGQYVPCHPVISCKGRPAYPPPPVATAKDTENIVPCKEHPLYDFTPIEVAGRWRFSLELLSPVFANDFAGGELGSILQSLVDFETREAKFWREMEHLRSAQSRDLVLDIQRERSQLVRNTFNQLNLQFDRRHQQSDLPIACQRLKAVFSDEPGEGSGVLRSFFTAIAEGLVSDDQLPELDKALVPRKTSHNRGDTIRDLCELRMRFVPEEKPAKTEPEDSKPVVPDEEWWSRVNCMGRGFMPTCIGPELHGLSVTMPSQRQCLGDRLYARCRHLHPTNVQRAVGMIVDTAPPTVILDCLRNNATLQKHFNQMLHIIETGQPSFNDYLNDLEERQEVCEVYTKGEGRPPFVLDGELAPLFFSPGKHGFFSPRPGPDTPVRCNAFRNVGRVIGLALLHNEMCPLRLCRHVLKFLLRRRVCWHDMAFFDPALYETLRQLLVTARAPDAEARFKELDLTFRAGIPEEENGYEVDLLPDGTNIPVTPDTVDIYVERLSTWHMVECAKKPLECMLTGLMDVLPSMSLHALGPEELRLLLNGCGALDFSALRKFTYFHDESGESSERTAKFKKWFWSVLKRMTPKQQHDLLCFWTSSPSLPATEQGYTPHPSVVIRPPDEARLPTANTCISRLYVPFYSSKRLLRTRLLTAIKTKVFGFV